MVLSVLGFLNLFASSLVNGMLLSNRFVAAPTLRALPPVTYATVYQVMIRRVAKAMPVLMGLAIVLPIPLLLILRESELGRRFWFTAAGEGFSVLVLASSLMTNVAISREVLQWDPKRPPEHWSAVRDRSDDYHTARAIVASLALACQIAAIV